MTLSSPTANTLPHRRIGPKEFRKGLQLKFAGAYEKLNDYIKPGGKHDLDRNTLCKNLIAVTKYAKHSSIAEKN